MYKPSGQPLGGQNKEESTMWAIMNTPDTLNNTPLWMLDAFCKEWRVSVTIENGKITEINDD